MCTEKCLTSRRFLSFFLRPWDSFLLGADHEVGTRGRKRKRYESSRRESQRSAVPRARANGLCVDAMELRH
jgi:hypothetical protein